MKIVDAQMKAMATQMQTLDDFVTRARRQNDQHHDAHIHSFSKMTSAARDSYTKFSEHLVYSNERASELGNSITSQTAELESTLPVLKSDIQQPLSLLRSQIMETALKEYTPTGETPQKTSYPIPDALPRTAPHDKLLNKYSSPKQTSPSKTKQSPSKPQVSPSKAPIYTDAPSPPDLQSPMKDRPATATCIGTSTGSLREINTNITPSANALTRHSDPLALPTVAGTEKPNSKDFEDLIKEVGMGPPPLKRQATGTNGESKFPTKLARMERGGKGEKENVQPSMTMRETRRGGLRSGGGT